jgi:uncharacterized membrane protein YedE/YeeE
MPLIAAFLCGLVFGLGLLISEMAQPAKILAFLDIFGDWDPSLIIVMISALVVSFLGFRLVEQRPHPLLTDRSFWPAKSSIDAPLVIGSVLFGIGWGLVGLCPGPALENLAALSPAIIVFVAAMAGGIGLHHAWQHSSIRVEARDNAASATDIDG